MFKKITSLMLVIALIATMLLVTGCGEKESKDSGDTIKIGLITPKTGKVAQYGIAVENAVKLAVDEYNANGGLLGKDIELISYDNKADQTESVTAFNRLANNDGIVALIGPVISSTSLTVGDIAQDEGIPMVTPTATNLDVTLGKDLVFRACYTDPYQGSTVGKFAISNLGAKKAAVLYNTDDDYSTGLAEAFVEAFEAEGGEVTNYEAYMTDDNDFKVVLTNVKANEPDVIFVPDYYNKVGLIATQVAELGIDATMLGGDGWDDVQKDYADVVEGFYFANHYAVDDPADVVQNFIAAYNDKYGETPNALGALGYDAALIMFEAIKSADSTDGEAIKEALQGTNLELVTGNVTFDDNGDTIKSISIIKIEDGELKLETKFGGQ